MKHHYSSARGAFLDIPCIQSWTGLSVTDLTVNYIEDGTESMRLVIPEGQSGTLNVKTLRYNEGKIVSVSCEPESGTARSPKLTLEIHHQGVTWIDVDSNALVRVSGVVALESADVSWNGYLDMSQAEIRSESFQTSVFQQSICRIGDMAVSHFKLSQGEDSRLYAENIRCEKQMSIFLRENCVAELKGQAGYLKAYLLDSAKLQAAGLQVKQADCICTLKSDLACRAQELNYYQSLTAKLTNSDPEAIYRSLADAGAFKQLRPLSVADAWVVATHLKSGDPEHPAEFRLAGKLYPEDKFSALMLVYRTHKTGRMWYLVDQFGSKVTPDRLDGHMMLAKTPEGQVLVDVSEEDVDWRKIPEVRKRFLQSRPVQYECMLKSRIE